MSGERPVCNECGSPDTFGWCASHKVLFCREHRHMEACTRDLHAEVAMLKALLMEMVGDYHRTGLIRDHVDPSAKGWDVNKDWRICEDELCSDVRVALPAPTTPAEP